MDGPAAGATTETTGAEELHVYIVARGQAMDRLHRYAKTALELGLAERQVRLAEQWGTTVGLLLRNVLDRLALTPEQEALAPAVVQEELARADNTALLERATAMAR